MEKTGSPAGTKVTGDEWNHTEMEFQYGVTRWGRVMQYAKKIAPRAYIIIIFLNRFRLLVGQLLLNT